MSEHAFVVRAIESGLRVDGRQRLEQRPLSMDLRSENGSVKLQMGGTQVLAVVTAELVEPLPDRMSEGVVAFFVEFSPMASPTFEVGRPSEDAVELSRLLERVLRKSQAVDIESLCVIAGKRVWSVRCDVTVLDHCGNLPDAALLASLAALKHYQLPAVAVSGHGDEAVVDVLPAAQAEPRSLVFHHTPVPVTFGFFRNAQSGALFSVVDPDEREEQVACPATVTRPAPPHGPLLPGPASRASPPGSNCGPPPLPCASEVTHGSHRR